MFASFVFVSKPFLRISQVPSHALFPFQVMAVLPISVLLLAVMTIFFGRTVSDPSQLVLGMTAAVLGLGSFIDALRVCVMPLSEQLGTELPKALPLPAVLGIAFFLGVLVTYAEPAISTLRPLAKIVKIEEAPYLYCILMVRLLPYIKRHSTKRTKQSSIHLRHAICRGLPAYRHHKQLASRGPFSCTSS
jgi:hypothetical protein